MGIALSKLKQLELGLYQDASDANLTLSQYLDEMSRKGEITEDLVNPEAANVKGEKVSAFKQLLAKAGIRTKGPMASTGDAFFSDPSNRVLFPEFVSTTYKDQERDLVGPYFLTINDIVTDRQGIGSSAHRTGIIESGQREGLEFGEVAEGGELPRYKVRLADQAINLTKYGGILEMTYESIRRASLPMIARYLGKIAQAQVYRKVKDALNVALNGDGNSNPAPDTASIGANWAFDDLIDLMVEGANNGVIFDFIVGETVDVTQVVKLAQFTDVAATAANADFRDTGRLPAPLGMDLKIAIPGSVLDGSKKLMGVDRGNALTEVFENGSQITETDKLITTQFEQIAISENLAYAKPDINAFRTKTRP